MATSARKLKSTPSDEAQLQLLYGEDSLTKYWSSSLFNTVYLRHDISDKHKCWKNEDDLDFQNFMNTLRNLAAEYKDREKELSNWSETETINNWVKHVLHALGWTNNCTGVQNPFLEETSFRYDGKTYRTDILIVDHPKEKQYVNQAKGDDKLKEARQSILMPVEVKYWQRLEEYRQGKKEEKDRTDNESDDISRATTPNEQTVQYMDILKRNWGILTDGARWRLFNSELSTEDAERFYEFNFFSLFQAMTTEETEADSHEIIEAAKYFYYFFSKFAFFPKNDGERAFVDDVLQYSKKYVNRVEDDLKNRFVKAMNIACNGFFKSAKKQGQNHELSVIRNLSESALFNLLFIKSLESRGVLPMTSTDYKKISLSSIIDKVERFDPEKEDLLNFRELERAFKKGNGNSFSYDPKGSELHDRILRLTGVIHKGASSKDNFGFEIAGFRESIFSENEWKIFKTCKISNDDWVRIVFEIGYAESESLNRKYQQIPYAYFTPRQLGSIYESFLEFKLDKASEDLVFEKKQWKPADLSSKKYRQVDLPKVSKGELFFTPDNEERKASGSYYTPDHVVQYIVKQTLEPAFSQLNPTDIFNIKVCDPAMGSGHFISAALRHLTAAFFKLSSDDSGEFKTFSEIKAQVLHNCIFGIDLNPRAVKLAKMSLWLETATMGNTLENLDDQLKCKNSVYITNNRTEPNTSTEDLLKKISENVIQFKESFLENSKYKSVKVTLPEANEVLDLKVEFPEIQSKGGFDIIVTNPPYLAFNYIQENLPLLAYCKFVLGLSYKFNLYTAILSNCLSLLNKTGRFGFIVPNSLSKEKFNLSLRKVLVDNLTIERALVFNELNEDVFPDASNDDYLVLVGTIKDSQNNSREIVVDSMQTKDCIVPKGTLKQEAISQNFEYQFQFQNTKSAKDAMAYKSILDKMEAGSVQLESFATIRVGLTPSRSFKKKYGDDFENYKTKYKSSKPLLPYINSNKVDNGVFNFRSKPGTKCIVWDRPELYADKVDPGQLEYYDCEKIITRNRGTQIFAALDKGSVVSDIFNICTPNLSSAEAKKFWSRFSMDFIVGLLNSKTFNFYFKNKYAFRDFKSAFIKAMPIKLDYSKEFESKVAKIAAEAAKKSDYQNYIKKIDLLLAKELELSDAEISIIQSFESQKDTGKSKGEEDQAA